MDDRGPQFALGRQGTVQRREFDKVRPSSRHEQDVHAHRFEITIIATVLARICAIAPNNATVSVCGAFGSFVGTNTSDPGPGAGLLLKRSDRRRVRTSPFA